MPVAGEPPLPPASIAVPAPYPSCYCLRVFPGLLIECPGADDSASTPCPEAPRSGFDSVAWAAPPRRVPNALSQARPPDPHLRVSPVRTVLKPNPWAIRQPRTQDVVITSGIQPYADQAGL